MGVLLAIYKIMVFGMVDWFLLDVTRKSEVSQIQRAVRGSAVFGAVESNVGHWATFLQ